jgi:CDP-ribitol ribitolphosphotransferase
MDFKSENNIVQLWHAPGASKKFGGSVDIESREILKKISENTDCLIVTSKHIIDYYSEAFQMPASKIKALGLPRMDYYFENHDLNKLKNDFCDKYNVSNDKKIILFSPTFRGTTADNAKYDYSQLDLERIYAFCKENNFVFLVKMHPFVKKAIEIPEEFSDLIIDYSSKDINDLIYMSDIMITDYSSCAYEYSFFNRPLVFFRYDKILYEYLRPLHTLDVFTEKQFEALDFDSLMSVLEQLKDVKKEERFSNVVERENECCQKIAEEILSL